MDGERNPHGARDPAVADDPNALIDMTCHGAIIITAPARRDVR